MRPSRRVLARHGAKSLIEGQSASRVAIHLAAVLVELGRQNEAELLIDDIAWELESRGKLSTANVVTANKLSNDLKKQLTAQIKKASRVSSVWLSEVVDQSVIGGVRIETPSKVWDQTVKRQLNELREVFNG